MADKILVVDDELDTLNLAKMILEKNGYQVVGAANGDEALQKADSERPDLILLDMVMPGKSGLERIEEDEYPPPKGWWTVG